MFRLCIANNIDINAILIQYKFAWVLLAALLYAWLDVLIS